MKTVWKYTLNQSGPTTIEMPLDPLILHAANQYEKCVVWAGVETQNPVGAHRFYVLATGGNMDYMPLNARYIGTVILKDGGGYLTRLLSGEEEVRKIMTLTVDVLVSDNTPFDKSVGVEGMAWDLCEQAGRYLRSQLQHQIDQSVDVKVKIRTGAS